MIQMDDFAEHLAAVLDLMPVAVGLIDREARFVGKSGQMAQVLGSVIPSRSITEAKKWIFTDASGAEIHRKDWPSARALRGEVLHEGLVGCFLKDGVWQPVRVVTLPIAVPETELAAMTFVQFLERERRAGDAYHDDLQERFIDTLVSAVIKAASGPTL